MYIYIYTRSQAAPRTAPAPPAPRSPRLLRASAFHSVLVLLICHIQWMHVLAWSNNSLKVFNAPLNSHKIVSPAQLDGPYFHAWASSDEASHQMYCTFLFVSALQCLIELQCSWMSCQPFRNARIDKLLFLLFHVCLSSAAVVAWTFLPMLWTQAVCRSKTWHHEPASAIVIHIREAMDPATHTVAVFQI